MPKTIDANIVKISVKNSDPAPSVTIEDVITVPKLVRLTTPMIIPTTAQAAMTANDWRAPSSNAPKISEKLMRVSARSILITTVKPMV